MGRRTNTAVWLEKYKRWQIKVQKDGIRKTFTSSTPGRTGQRDCNKKADEWLDDGIENNNKKVSEFIKIFLDYLETNKSKSDYELCEKCMRIYIKPSIGAIKLDRLTEQHLQNVIDISYKDKKLSKKTLENIRYVINKFIKYLRRNKMSKLYLEGLEIPKQARIKQKIILQPDSLKTLFTVNTQLRYGKQVLCFYIYAFRFAVITGLRPGELLGLMWSDIKGNQILASRSHNVYGEITEGKNINAQRTFALPELAVLILDLQREMLKEKGIKSDFVFPDEYGEITTQNIFYKRWVKYRDSNKLDGASPYGLRHTFVSISKSLPIELLQPVVGHSKNMDTLGVYSHEIQSEKEKTAQLINEIFSKIIT